MIPGTAVVDVRVGGEIDKFFWSLSVQNVFNTLYFDYAIASAFTFGTYNAYPLPGRTYLVTRRACSSEAYDNKRRAVMPPGALLRQNARLLRRSRRRPSWRPAAFAGCAAGSRP